MKIGYIIDSLIHLSYGELLYNKIKYLFSVLYKLETAKAIIITVNIFLYVTKSNTFY